MKHNSKKKRAQVLHARHANFAALPPTKENQTKTRPSSEKMDRIERIKKECIESRIVELEKKISTLRKKASDKQVDIGHDESAFVPLNDDEERVVAEWKERVKNSVKNPIAFTYTLDDKGKEVGSIETNDGYPVAPTDKYNLWSAALNLATGSANPQFGYHLVQECFNASGFSKPCKDKGSDLNAVLHAMQALKPQDEIEGMLITQLISLYYQSMKYLACTHNEGATTEGINTNISRSSKLLRLHHETLEVLMKYRRRGEQRVMVTHQYVQVNNGGKAIVGNVLNEGVQQKIGEVTP